MIFSAVSGCLLQCLNAKAKDPCLGGLSKFDMVPGQYLGSMQVQIKLWSGFFQCSTFYFLVALHKDP